MSDTEVDYIDLCIAEASDEELDKAVNIDNYEGWKDLWDDLFDYYSDGIEAEEGRERPKDDHVIRSLIRTVQKYGTEDDMLNLAEKALKDHQYIRLFEAIVPICPRLRSEDVNYIENDYWRMDIDTFGTLLKNRIHFDVVQGADAARKWCCCWNESHYHLHPELDKALCERDDQRALIHITWLMQKYPPVGMANISGDLDFPARRRF